MAYTFYIGSYSLLLFIMNLRPFIKTHLRALMTNFDVQKGPFDSYLREYYKNNRTLGPSERSIIS